jgi:hypothetical protein
MKIIIELDSSTEQQPEVKKVSTHSQQQQVASSDLSVSSSPVDAGHARIPDGYANDSSSQMMQQLPGNTSFPIAGAIDAGAPKVQQEVTVASAMPDTGNMETLNTSNAFPAGAFAGSVHN